MGIAIAATPLGVWFTNSALQGVSLADAFTGKGATLDPSGSVPGGNAPDGSTSTTGSPDTDTPQVSGGKGGTTTIDGHPVANWVAVQVFAARAYGWTGAVTSGYRTYAEQVQACIHVCGNPNGCPGTCAKPGTSNHRGTRYPLGAVDITNGPQFDAALARAKRAGAAGPYPTIRNALPSDLVHRSASGK
jgi:hypothetical protein